MKKLFEVKKTYFANKLEAKEFRDEHGGTLKLGPDHIGRHGCNKVTQHMRNRRKAR